MSPRRCPVPCGWAVDSGSAVAVSAVDSPGVVLSPVGSPAVAVAPVGSAADSVVPAVAVTPVDGSPAVAVAPVDGSPAVAVNPVRSSARLSSVVSQKLFGVGPFRGGVNRASRGSWASRAKRYSIRNKCKNPHWLICQSKVSFNQEFE